ncbi:exonuclease 1 isoform X2 [Halyomorpha halys]|uniref:exonuclease 1 isoform X2 n=1 Tax=Halyomorpha halys TaxID=286706 RepID=UPI0006D4E68B|nr:exonuclease 1 isoform X2 [Halyomorpha halys]
MKWKNTDWFAYISDFKTKKITADFNLKVLFKMDLNGNGVLIEQQKIPLAMKQHPNQFSMDKFRYMCILSGCDYLKSLPGIGLAKACKFIKKTADDNIKRALTRLGAYLNMPNLIVTEDYRDKFVEADHMFKYQPVFDPLTRKVVTLNPLPDNINSPLADCLSREKSYQLALGNLNPFTLEQVDSWNPDEPQAIKTNGWKTTIQRHKSIWSKDYKLPPSLPPKKDPRDVSRQTTKGKIAMQPVSTLTEKIAALPPKPDIGEEISKLRESYGFKTSIASKLSESEKKVESNEVNFNVATDDVFQEILKTPEKSRPNDSTEFTLDDILGGDGSPILEGKVWRNPFSSSSNQKKGKQLNKPGGALDRFSKLRRTVVEEACIVQSRYFSSPVEVKPDSHKCITQETGSSSLNKSLEDIMASPLRQTDETDKLNTTIIQMSPDKNSFLVTDILDHNEEANSRNAVLCSPKKNAFSVTSIIDDDVLNTAKIGSPSPRKNIFSVTSPADCRASVPKPQSFLNIIDSLSKNAEADEQPKNEKPVKKLSSPSFKWKQPLLDFSFKKSPAGNDKSCTSQSPQAKLSIKTGKSPNVKKRAGSLLEKNNVKRKSTENGVAQQSLFDMFAFTPKPKLKMQ